MSPVLEYLEANKLWHIGMIFPIKRGTAEILYAGKDGVFLRERKSGAFMLSVNCSDKGISLLDSVGEQKLFCIHQELPADYLVKKYGFEHCEASFQAVYRSKNPIRHTNRLKIVQLNPANFKSVYEIYPSLGEEYIGRRLKEGGIYGGFIDDVLCGIVGTHEEGSIGMLKTLPEYRRQGLAAELESYIVNIILERGEVPFAQVFPDNKPSIDLHLKLGFELSDEVVYWVY